MFMQESFFKFDDFINYSTINYCTLKLKFNPYNLLIFFLHLGAYDKEFKLVIKTKKSKFLIFR